MSDKLQSDSSPTQFSNHNKGATNNNKRNNNRKNKNQTGGPGHTQPQQWQPRPPAAAPSSASTTPHQQQHPAWGPAATPQQAPGWSPGQFSAPGQPWYAPYGAGPGLLGPRPPPAAYAAYAPSPWPSMPPGQPPYWPASAPLHALAHSFNGMTLRTPQDQWYMDSGASNHFASNPGMLGCKPISTPVDTQGKLSANDSPSVDDPTSYRALAGALQYLTFTRPDIAFAVHQICLFMHDPRQSHFAALKRILRYLRGNIDHGIRINRMTEASLVAYSDADWAGCPDSRRSTSGYCVFMGGNLISWSSKRQHTVSRSSAEAEYRGIANAVAEIIWLRQLLSELCISLVSSSLVYCDNVSSVYMSHNPVQHQRTKHIEIDLHFVRDQVALGQVRVLHVPSSHQYADIFTKGRE